MEVLAQSKCSINNNGVEVVRGNAVSGDIWLQVDNTETPINDSSRLFI